MRGNWRSLTRTAEARCRRRNDRSVVEPMNLRSNSSNPGIFFSALSAARSAGCSQVRELISGKARFPARPRDTTSVLLCSAMGSPSRARTARVCANVRRGRGAGKIA